MGMIWLQIFSEVAKSLFIYIVVVSFRPPRDHATCPYCTKQASDTRPLLELPSGSSRSIQIPSSPDS